MIHLPIPKRWLLLATALYAVAFFFWIGIEDTAIAPVAVLGAAGAILVFAHGVRARFPAGEFHVGEWFVIAIFGGTLTGVGAALITILLMAIKVSLHSHSYPDYSPTAVVGLFARAPQWGAAGLLIGFGLALIGYSRRA